jgi:hypothetical protein
MVSIDNVYQKVLALANKEQRGYITPKEFNLFAHQAQLEIFEQYFYDLNQFLRLPGNSEEYSNITTNLREKIVIFEATGNVVNGVITPTAGDVLYRLGTIIDNGIIVEEVQPDDNPYIVNSPLLAPSTLRPIYIRSGTLSVNMTPPGGPYTCTYVRLPRLPQWGYIVVSGRALHDGNPVKTTNFELHASEEPELVYKILKLAGVSMKRDELARAGGSLESQLTQQEKQ